MGLRIGKPSFLSDEHMLEKRKHKRSILVSYFDTYEREEKVFLGYLADISYGGMTLVSKKPIETNQVMSIQIEVSNDDNKRNDLLLDAKCIHCKEQKNHNYFNIGFELKEITETDINNIDDLMSLYEL